MYIWECMNVGMYIYLSLCCMPMCTCMSVCLCNCISIGQANLIAACSFAKSSPNFL